MATGKTALVFGASGLVGTFLYHQLMDDPRYDKIKIFARRPIKVDNPKVDVIMTDFNKFDAIADSFKGDEIFCCLGSTMRKAGSKEAFKGVDHKLPVIIGKMAVSKGISKMAVISAVGANEQSPNFYLRTKGQMESELRDMHIKDLRIFRPSMLLGSRDEFRPGEMVGKMFLVLTGWAFVSRFRKYRAVHASVVARAMINCFNTPWDDEIVEADAIRQLGK